MLKYFYLFGLLIFCKVEKAFSYPFYSQSLTQSCLECHTQNSGYGSLSNLPPRGASSTVWLNPHAKMALYQYFEKSNFGDEAKFDSKNFQLQFQPKYKSSELEIQYQFSFDRVPKTQASKLTDYIYSPYSFFQISKMNKTLRIGQFLNYAQSKRFKETERLQQIEYTHFFDNNFSELSLGSTFQRFVYNDTLPSENNYYINAQLNLIQQYKILLGYEIDSIQKTQLLLFGLLNRSENLWFIDLYTHISENDQKIKSFMLTSQFSFEFETDFFVSPFAKYFNSDIRKSDRFVEYGIMFQKHILPQLLIKLNLMHTESDQLNIGYSDQIYMLGIYNF